MTSRAVARSAPPSSRRGSHERVRTRTRAEDSVQSRLPRPQLLVVRPGRPSAGRPRGAGGLADQPAAGLHRRTPAPASRCRRAFLLARQGRWFCRAAARGHLVGPCRRARRARAAAPDRRRGQPGQDPRLGPARRLQRHLCLRRRDGRPGCRSAGRPHRQPPRTGRAGIRPCCRGRGVVAAGPTSCLRPLDTVTRR